MLGWILLFYYYILIVVMFLTSGPIVEHFMLPPIPFIPMLFPVIMIAFVLIKCGDIIVPLVELVPKVIEAALLIFNPKKFIDDIIFGVGYAIKLVVGGMMDSMDSGTDSNREVNPDDVPKVCIPPSLFNLALLVLCPPLAIMINFGGIKGIFLTVVCAILTVWCYYFPGLIFAAIHILC